MKLQAKKTTEIKVPITIEFAENSPIPRIALSLVDVAIALEERYNGVSWEN